MQNKQLLDFSTIFGICAALLMIMLAIVIEGNLLAFVDLPAFLIVMMGTLLVTTACFSFADMHASVAVIYRMIFFKMQNPQIMAIKLLKLSELARKTPDFKALSQALSSNQYDPFLCKGLEMAIDGSTPELIEKIFGQEIISNAERHNRVVLIMRKAAETSPAMGLIGTLIGLVQMLSNLNDPAKLGPSMAIALLTTFYGAILSYVVFFPLASKIERNSRDDILLEKIYLKVVISIARKENPRHLETVINSLLSPTHKFTYFK